MTVEPPRLCDFTGDGYCDEQDVAWFQGVIGRCVGETGYHPFADIDQDGCITDTDEQLLFRRDSDEDGVPDAGDKCPLSDSTPTVVIAGCDSLVHNKGLNSGCTISGEIDWCAFAAMVMWNRW